MTVTQYYAAATLDGFIADPNDSLDWLVTRDRSPGGALDYDRFIADVGALAMGATTYEWLLEHATSGWPYEAPCWVFAHRPVQPVPGAAIEIVHGDVAPVHERMVDAAAGRNVWIVGGGDLAGQFAAAGLLDEVLVSIAPVTLGAGAPLLPRHVELRLEDVGRNGDFAAIRYTVVRHGA